MGSDSITFTVHVVDIVSAGLRCNMNMHSQLLLGPLQIQLHNEIVGETVLDIRRTVLPACAQGRAVTHDGTTIWQTPVDVVPLTRIDSDPHSGLQLVVVGQVALSFSDNVDPSILIQEATEVARPLAERMLGHCALGCGRGRFPTECGNEPAPSPPIYVDDTEREQTLKIASSAAHPATIFSPSLQQLLNVAELKGDEHKSEEAVRVALSPVIDHMKARRRRIECADR